MIRILLVEDEVYALESLKTLMYSKNQWAAVYTALSAAEAKRIIETTPVDILVTDIEMPHQSGLELLGWVRDMGLEMECVILTCHESFTYAREALRLGSIEYLVKPVDGDALFGAIARAAKARSIKTPDASDINFHQSGTGEPLSPVEAVKRFIKDNISQDITRQMLEAHVHLNRDHLNRIFKKEVGLSIADYIAKERMEIAKDLLLNTDMSIGEVSFWSGYKDISYFSRFFKNFTGKSPITYRKEPCP